MADINYDTDITDEMYESVAQSLLYRTDPCQELKKIVPKNWKVEDVKGVYRHILRDKDRLDKIKKDYLEVESATLIEDDTDTIMLVYNRLLQKAQFEQKYDVVTRILSEIRKLKAINNQEMKFEITIKVDKPGKEEKA